MSSIISFDLIAITVVIATLSQTFLAFGARMWISIVCPFLITLLLTVLTLLINNRSQLKWYLRWKITPLKHFVLKVSPGLYMSLKRFYIFKFCNEFVLPEKIDIDFFPTVEEKLGNFKGLEIIGSEWESVNFSCFIDNKDISFYNVYTKLGPQVNKVVDPTTFLSRIFPRDCDDDLDKRGADLKEMLIKFVNRKNDEAVNNNNRLKVMPGHPDYRDPVVRIEMGKNYLSFADVLFCREGKTGVYIHMNRQDSYILVEVFVDGRLNYNLVKSMNGGDNFDRVLRNFRVFAMHLKSGLITMEGEKYTHCGGVKETIHDLIFGNVLIVRTESSKRRGFIYTNSVETNFTKIAECLMLKFLNKTVVSESLYILKNHLLERFDESIAFDVIMNKIGCKNLHKQAMGSSLKRTIRSDLNRVRSDNNFQKVKLCEVVPPSRVYEKLVNDREANGRIMWINTPPKESPLKDVVRDTDAESTEGKGESEPIVELNFKTSILNNLALFKKMKEDLTSIRNESADLMLRKENVEVLEEEVKMIATVESEIGAINYYAGKYTTERSANKAAGFEKQYQKCLEKVSKMENLLDEESRVFLEDISIDDFEDIEVFSTKACNYLKEQKLNKSKFILTEKKVFEEKFNVATKKLCKAEAAHFNEFQISLKNSFSLLYGLEDTKSPTKDIEDTDSESMVLRGLKGMPGVVRPKSRLTKRVNANKRNKRRKGTDEKLEQDLREIILIHKLESKLSSCPHKYTLLNDLLSKLEVKNKVDTPIKVIDDKNQQLYSNIKTKSKKLFKMLFKLQKEGGKAKIERVQGSNNSFHLDEITMAFNNQSITTHNLFSRMASEKELLVMLKYSLEFLMDKSRILRVGGGKDKERDELKDVIKWIDEYL